MNPVRIQYKLYLLLIIAVVACNTSDNKNNVAAGTLPFYQAVDTAKPSGPVVTENDIIDTLNALPFVKEGNRHIDSLSHHKHAMAFIIDTADNEYNVKAGYDREVRFETYYTFSVDKKTRAIKVLDVISGQMITPAEFEKRIHVKQ